jgi:acyl-CoA dehydrogenase
MPLTNVSTLGFGRPCFDDEHETYRESFRRFLQRHVEPNLKQWEKDGYFPADLFREAGRAGLLCPGIPAEYGGGGGDVRHQVILHEEYCYLPGGASLESGLTTDFTSYCFLNNGTEEQRAQWLPRMASGEEIIEIAISEADAGSDVQGIKTHAVRDGDDYILNGHKMWITNGPLLTSLLVVARTPAPDGRRTFSMFIVPVNTKGVTHVGPTDLLLKNCSGVSEFFFDDVRIPARDLLGGVEGRGLAAAFAILTLGRICTSARAMATAELALALTLDYTKQRKAFGSRIIDFQNSQFQLAAAAADIAAGRALIDKLISSLPVGTVSDADAATAKYFTTEAEWRVLEICLQLYGGAGFSNDQPISKMWTLGRVHRIYGGTSEIMRTIIARSLIEE